MKLKLTHLYVSQVNPGRPLRTALTVGSGVSSGEHGKGRLEQRKFITATVPHTAEDQEDGIVLDVPKQLGPSYRVSGCRAECLETRCNWQLV